MSKPNKRVVRGVLITLPLTALTIKMENKQLDTIEIIALIVLFWLIKGWIA